MLTLMASFKKWPATKGRSPKATVPVSAMSVSAQGKGRRIGGNAGSAATEAPLAKALGTWVVGQASLSS